jgi:hypothetical protein
VSNILQDDIELITDHMMDAASLGQCAEIARRQLSHARFRRRIEVLIYVWRAPALDEVLSVKGGREAMADLWRRIQATQRDNDPRATTSPASQPTSRSLVERGRSGGSRRALSPVHSSRERMANTHCSGVCRHHAANEVPVNWCTCRRNISALS